MSRRRRLFWSVALAYVVTWVLISWLSSPAFDSYGDMVENYAWSQTWAWGTFKHPPFFAWIVGVWFAVLPTAVWSYYLLSYLNAAIGILGIVCLGRLWLPQDLSAARRDVFVMAVLLFAILSLPYSNLAAKFNADTVLLSLWPWTAYAFFAALHAVRPRDRLLFAVLLGLMAAAAMLGKYYSALLLASFLIISLSHRDYRRWYRTKYPYIALGAFFLLLLPHAIWQGRVGFPFRQYLETRIDQSMDPGRIVLFLLSGIYYLPLSWLAWLLLRRRFAAAEQQPVAWAIPPRGLVLLCVLPALLTVSFNVFARIHLTTHWAIPIWFALPVLLAVWLLPHIGDDFAWTTLTNGLAVFLAVLLAVALAYTATLSATGNGRYSLARQQMVKTIETRFAARFPGQQLSWVGGTWPETGALAFFAANRPRPRALPGLPDDTRALVDPFPAWQDTYGVILCYASGAYAREGSHDAECEDQTRSWLRTHNRPIEEETLTYHAEGWRFIRAQPKNVTVFWIPPARQNSAEIGTWSPGGDLGSCAEDERKHHGRTVFARGRAADIQNCQSCEVG